MITRIEINGFKSFHEFKLDLAPLTLLTGNHKAGSKDLFEALTLLSQLTQVNALKAFHSVHPTPKSVASPHRNLKTNVSMEFAVELLLDPYIKGPRGSVELLRYHRLRYEISIIFWSPLPTIIYESLLFIPKSTDDWSRRYPINWVNQPAKALPLLIDIADQSYDGFVRSYDDQFKEEHTVTDDRSSILSKVIDLRFIHALAVKQALSRWQHIQWSADTLSKPSTLQSLPHIDALGNNLAATLYRLSRPNLSMLEHIAYDVSQVFPFVSAIHIEENASDNSILLKVANQEGEYISADTLDDRQLQAIAFATMAQDHVYGGTFTIEHPEKGIDDIRIQALFERLLNSFPNPPLNYENGALEEQPLLRQLLLTTDSPTLIQSHFSQMFQEHIIVYWITTQAYRNNQQSYRVTYMKVVETDPHPDTTACSARSVIDALKS